MSPLLSALAGVLLGYLVGSIPTSWIAGRLLRGVDLRRHGSGNLGATNVYRTLGAAPAAAVVLVDVGKGWAAAALLPALVAGARAAPDAALSPGALAVACGAAAIVGHVFPVWLGFRGGKGVATGIGAFAALSPLATIGAVVVWALLVWRVRIVSVASLVLGLCLPALVALEQAGRMGGDLRVAVAAAAAVFVFWTHRENLRRLARGEERPISRAAGSRP